MLHFWHLLLFSSWTSQSALAQINPVAHNALVKRATTTRPSTVGTVTISGTASTYSVQFTVPADAQNGAPILPNVNDPQAKNAQDVCPGYKASDVKQTSSGVTARLTLAGKGCNVYGTDINSLALTVEYQSDSRLSVNIAPVYIVGQS
jgi:alpha-glucosidase